MTNKTEFNKKDLMALGFDVIEDETMYAEVMKDVYDDIFGKWADFHWNEKVLNRKLDNFNLDFVKSVFGNYDVLGYTTIETVNRKVAFLNREHYFMEADSDISTLAILHLFEVKTFSPNDYEIFRMITNR